MSYFAEIGWQAVDVAHLGKFLREINVGRSVDCLPQGLNPCKVIGAEFLRFIDNSARLRSPLLLRFLDDIVLYSDSEAELTTDLLTIQELLAEKGLSLNSAKTILRHGSAETVEDEVDQIKQRLLRIRQEIIEVSGEPIEVDVEEHDLLDEEQTQYLLTLLRDDNLEEGDAELVLTLLTEHGEEVLAELGKILARFPTLAKTLYSFLGKTEAREGLAGLLLQFLSDRSQVATEYQLFWLAATAERYLASDAAYGDVLVGLFEHPFATDLSQARVLEIADNRFGLPELRTTYLRSGQSGWLAWASAAGSRNQTLQSRNHVLSYFANAGPLNGVIASILAKASATTT